MVVFPTAHKQIYFLNDNVCVFISNLSLVCVLSHLTRQVLVTMAYQAIQDSSWLKELTGRLKRSRERLHRVEMTYAEATVELTNTSIGDRDAYHEAEAQWLCARAAVQYAQMDVQRLEAQCAEYKKRVIRALGPEFE